MIIFCFKIFLVPFTYPSAQISECLFFSKFSVTVQFGLRHVIYVINLFIYVWIHSANMKLLFSVREYGDE